jgi:hypothetical protein
MKWKGCFHQGPESFIFIKSIFQMYVISIVLLCTAFSLDISYDFKCKSNDKTSTMIQYSHLRDGGITQGYEASSFNYLANGRIEFADTIEYLQRVGDVSKKSSIYRNTDISFEGESSISDIYTKGLFADAKDISSRKKVWSNSFNSIYPPQYRPKSSVLHMDAKMELGPARKDGAIYNLVYNAAVINGIFSIMDSARFAKNIRANGVYWEQSALIKGNITLNNNLVYGNLLKTGR